MLADAVVLRRRLVRGTQDGLGLAEVEDDARGLDTSDRTGDDLAFAVGELVEQRLALSLTQALTHDLSGDLCADPTKMGGIELLVLHKIAEDRRGIMLLSVRDRPLGRLVLDLRHHQAGAIDAHVSGFGIEADVDVLIPWSDAPIGALDGILDGADQLLAGTPFSALS